MDESPEGVRSFRRSLLDFFDARARALPWRETSDPYAIWVSEIMAQQTRVETVVPYYRRWLERFPTVSALAEAPLDDVLKAWEGLGYYSRARNLHRAAGVVLQEHGGRIPDTVVGLRSLPGVGDYTAGAVASIAFDRPAPAVDGNVRRVFARLFDDAAPAAGEVVRWAEGVVDPARPGDFNQALMELGATVCTPRNPGCGDCPVAGHCAALVAGTVASRPAPKNRPTVRREVRAVGVFVRRSPSDGRSGEPAPAQPRGEPWRALLRRRPDTGLLAGMWEFPSVAVGARAGDRAVLRAVTTLARELGLTPDDDPGRGLDPVSHSFSHLHVTYRPWLLVVDDGVGSRGEPPVAAEPGDPETFRWVDPGDPGDLALPVAQQRIGALVGEPGPLRRAHPDARLDPPLRPAGGHGAHRPPDAPVSAPHLRSRRL